MIVIRKAVIGLFVGFWLNLISSCENGESSLDDELLPIRRYISPTVRNKEADEVRGVFMWPSERLLEQNEISELARPIIELAPQWGKFANVYQSEGRASSPELFLIVELDSGESSDSFFDFCRSLGHEEGVALVYSGEDKIYFKTIAEIEASNIRITEQSVPPKSDRAGG